MFKRDTLLRRIVRLTVRLAFAFFLALGLHVIALTYQAYVMPDTQLETITTVMWQYTLMIALIANAYDLVYWVIGKDPLRWSTGADLVFVSEWLIVLTKIM